MTSSRIIRGTKARIFIGICAVLAVTAIIACYNSALSQLDEVKKSNEICHQQEENLATQLQVISEYKQKLENSLKSEKGEHQQSRTNLEHQLNATQTECKKNASDASVRFNSLQQHFKLLKTEHSDFKDNCNNEKEKLLAKASELQETLGKIQDELKAMTQLKDNLQAQVSTLELSIKDQEQKTDSELKKELETLKLRCPSFESLPLPSESVPEQNVLDSALHTNGSISGLNEAKPLELNPLNNENLVKLSQKSTTSSSMKNASLEGVPPLLVPSVTPESDDQKLPKGVVPVPMNLDVEKAPNDNNLPNARYANKIDMKEDRRDENLGHEMGEVLGFGDNDVVKSDDKENAKKDLPAVGENEYKDNANNDLQLEEDDDPDDYRINLERKDPVVRN